MGLMGALAAQVALGASVIWLRREPVITSLHVVNGAVVLGTALLLAVRATRLNALPASSPLSPLRRLGPFLQPEPHA